MGKYTKKKKMPRAVGIAAGAIVVLMAVVMLCLGGDKTPNQDPEDMTLSKPAQVQELLVQSVTEQEDVVLVETTYGTIKYPYAFSDLISVEAENFGDHAVLEFGAIMDDTVIKVYTLIFNEEGDMPVGTLQVNGEAYMVTAQFYDAEDVSEENMVIFYAAQETFNDVVNSLSENEGFTPEN